MTHRTFSKTTRQFTLSFQNSQNSWFESKQSVALGGGVMVSFFVVVLVVISVAIGAVIDVVVVGNKVSVVVVGVGKLRVVVGSSTVQDRHVN